MACRGLRLAILYCASWACARVCVNINATFAQVETQLSAFKNALLTGQHPFPLVSAARKAQTHVPFQSTDRLKSDASTVPGVCACEDIQAHECDRVSNDHWVSVRHICHRTVHVHENLIHEAMYLTFLSWPCFVCICRRHAPRRNIRICQHPSFLHVRRAPIHIVDDAAAARRRGQKRRVFVTSEGGR